MGEASPGRLEPRWQAAEGSAAAGCAPLGYSAARVCRSDEDRTQILTEHPAEAFEFPPGKGDRFTLIQATMFAGRSLNAKRRLYRAVVRNLGCLGIPPSDVLIVLHEVPLENWGVRGGMPASDVDLGFEVGL